MSISGRRVYFFYYLTATGNEVSSEVRAGEKMPTQVALNSVCKKNVRASLTLAIWQRRRSVSTSEFLLVSPSPPLKAV